MTENGCNILRKSELITTLPGGDKRPQHLPATLRSAQDEPGCLACFRTEDSPVAIDSDDVQVEFFNHELADVARNPKTNLDTFVEKWGMPFSPLHSSSSRTTDLAVFAQTEVMGSSMFVHVPTNIDEAVDLYEERLRAGFGHGNPALGEAFIKEELRTYASTIWAGKSTGIQEGSHLVSYCEAELTVKALYEAIKIVSFCEAGFCDGEFLKHLFRIYKAPKEAGSTGVKAYEQLNEHASVLVLQHIADMSAEQLIGETPDETRRRKAVEGLKQSALAYLNEALTPIKITRPIELIPAAVAATDPRAALLHCDVIQLAAIQFFNELDALSITSEKDRRVPWRECPLCGTLFKYQRPYRAKKTNKGKKTDKQTTLPKDLTLAPPAVRGMSDFCTREHQILQNYQDSKEFGPLRTEQKKSNKHVDDKDFEVLKTLGADKGKKSNRVNELTAAFESNGGGKDIEMSLNLQEKGADDGRIDEIVDILLDHTTGLTSLPENLRDAERFFLRTSLLLLRDYFPKKDQTLKGLMTLLSLTDCSGKQSLAYRENNASAYALMLHQVCAGKKYVKRKNSDEFHWVDSKLRRNYDGEMPAGWRGIPSRQGFIAEEDETVAAYLSCIEEAGDGEGAQQMLLDCKVRLFDLSRKLNRPIVVEEEKEAAKAMNE